MLPFRTLRLPSLFAILMVVAGVSPLAAQELFLLGGVMQNNATRESSYSWQLEYRERLGQHLSAGLSYLNEGHVPDHHRDGHAATLWGHLEPLGGRLSLSAGLGPYFYYDTTNAHAEQPHHNDHGWGAMFNLAAIWRSQGRLRYQLRANYVETFNSIDTISVLAGIGYDLDPSPPQPGGTKPAVEDHTPQAGNELTLFAGQTIANSFDSDRSVAVSLEYRRELHQYLDGTVAWIYEGDNRLIRRNGLSVQLWGVKRTVGNQFSIGIGGGAYISINRYGDLHRIEERSNRTVSGLVTLTASYRILPEWAIRTSWHRTVTTYDRDTDIILAGIGYLF